MIASGAKFRLRLLFQEVDLLPGRFTLGRSTACSLTIDDPLVSREHAEILVDDDGARVRDLGSRNGTELNGELLRDAVRLRHGDRLRVGGYEFVFIVQLADLPRELRSTVEVGGRPELAIPDESTAPVAVKDIDRVTDSMARRNARMIDEVIAMALSLGHHDRAAELVDRQISAFERKLERQGFNLDDLVRLCEFNLAVGHGLRDPSRIRWVIGRWSELGRAMPPELVPKIAGAARGVCDPRPEISIYLAVLTASRALSETCPELIGALRELV
jgi:pSer/pThr/pTyr-binding forkhead associated (FHA) protein